MSAFMEGRFAQLVAELEALRRQVVELRADKKQLQRELFMARCSLERAHGERLRLAQEVEARP